ncbi:DUF3800 domain-containing protein [Mucilaginibacter sp. SG564]|uniref:DUF3800 domain-containing protein n=1 Tax=Mucilaginibacter sp. SG564 TaxID=2587022 RepID=UPI00155370FC|nr:DUF3800 domain-containing protein [Mucilaginibacter sp. SG564]NOW94013.1 hypothetical protein [Mucilaginibacter sp. SG564]
MATYFGFSDECGDYKAEMSSKQAARHPFYVRSTLIINSDEWKLLSINFKELKKKYGIPLNFELKWAYLWSLKFHEDRNKVIPDKHDIKPFENLGYKLLISFVGDALGLINQLREKKIIITYTDNLKAPKTNEKSMLSFHLQEHMQRIEMELKNGDNLAVLFLDPVNDEKNEYLRQLYYELFESGDYVKYGHIKDSLNIENSHHSVGIQLADYISGSFSAILKSDDTGNYMDGIRMYFDSVHDNLRRSYSGAIQGYGIREVPQNHLWRKSLTEKLIQLESINDRVRSV